MDRSQRLSCSSASQSTGINTRKRNRAASAGGDGLSVNKEQGKRGQESGSESKAHYSKCKPPANPKSCQKSKKSTKTSIGSLQNAVVLAPFHTLKKSFQSKLVNFYSFEKLKKMKRKSRMTKKRNMAFEYDIIELNPQLMNIKKEKKTNVRVNQKTKPTEYCQCKKIRQKTEKKDRRSNQRMKKKQNGKLPPGLSPLLPGQFQNKRRKLNPQAISKSFKCELSPQQHFFIPISQAMSEQYQTSSAVSSHSKVDSWETYSHIPSSKEEYMEGALAMSTTTFDGFMENFDKDGWDSSDSSDAREKREKPNDADLIEKPHGSSSRLPIRPTEKKSSDGQIVDFMDREPQNSIITSEESHQHLQPLQPQSKTKTKNDETDGRHSRSVSFHKDSLASSQKFCMDSVRSFQIEIGTQVEKENLLGEEKLDLEFDAGIPLEKTIEPSCGFSSSKTQTPFPTDSGVLPPNVSREVDAEGRDAVENSSQDQNQMENEFSLLYFRASTPEQP